MIENIPLALTSLKAAKDIITTIRDLRDFTKIAEATSQLNERLIEAGERLLAEQEQLFTLQKRVFELEKENDRLKDWSVEKENYTTKPITQGVLAYINKDFIGDPQNEYKLCCGCFEKGIKSPLQQNTQAGGLVKKLVCANGCPPIEFDNFLEVK